MDVSKSKSIFELVVAILYSFYYLMWIGPGYFRPGQSVLLPWFGHGRQVLRQRRLECHARWRRRWKLIVNELDEVLRKTGGLRLLRQEILHAMRVLLHEVII